MTAMDVYDQSGLKRIPGARRRKLAAWSALASALGVIAFGFGFVFFASHVAGMQTPETPANAEAVIVLTGGRQRIDAATRLLKAGNGKRLLITGVSHVADRQDILAATGLDPALFACCVDIDREAQDTIGNAEESAKWMRDHGFSSALVVTNNYHMPRSLLEMRRQYGNAVFHPYPVVTITRGRFGWIGDREASRVLFTEYLKYLGAWARGAVPGLGDRIGRKMLGSA